MTAIRAIVLRFLNNVKRIFPPDTIGNTPLPTELVNCINRSVCVRSAISSLPFPCRFPQVSEYSKNQSMPLKQRRSIGILEPGYTPHDLKTTQRAPLARSSIAIAVFL